MPWSPPTRCTSAALQMIKDAIKGKLDWQGRRAAKKAPLRLSKLEAMMSFTTAAGMVAAVAGKHYPAPMAAVKTVEAAAGMGRDEALAAEAATFIKLAKTDVAKALVGHLPQRSAHQGAGQEGRQAGKQGHRRMPPCWVPASWGAASPTSRPQGHPGGDEGHQREGAGTWGMNEATKLLNGQRVEQRSHRRRIKMARCSQRHHADPQSYDNVKHVDLVVEAVVENPTVKRPVLAEVEGVIGEDAVLASNTSTIPISLLAKGLKRPENFCGMHFFNPVHRMPLVEIIRGEQTSDETINRVVAYAAAMGKSPVVVNDCPGFFVNRVLFPYFFGFNKLVADGADFAAVDKVMENEFGWPMGPAYLLDVVGIDTGHHAGDVMAQGFPARMSKEGRYRHRRNVRRQPLRSEERQGLLRLRAGQEGQAEEGGRRQPATSCWPRSPSRSRTFDKEAIIARMMIPMINEVVLCLEEGIVATPAEADIALVYGLGFPPFRGGVFRYLDTIGLDRYVAMADQYADLGPLYRVSDRLREMAAQGKTFY